MFSFTLDVFLDKNYAAVSILDNLNHYQALKQYDSEQLQYTKFLLHTLLLGKNV